MQETWQGTINEDLEALAERKLIQATKEEQYPQQRQAARQTVLLEEGPSMREALQDKVPFIKEPANWPLPICMAN